MIRRSSYTVLSSSSCHLRRRLHQTSLLQSACNLMNTSDVVLPSRSVATLRIMPSTNPNDLAASSHNNIARSQPRLCFSTVATTANASSPSSSNESTSSTNNKKEKDKKDDSNIFLDNLGKIFLSSIGLVLLFLLRSTKSNNSRVALREEMENAALLDPLEIEDLRCANSDFTMEVWNTIVEEIKNEFVARGISSMTYPQFLSLVMRVMKDVKGEGFTVQMGHLMDRVVIAELERRREGNDNAAGHQEGSDELPLSFLLASLSLALNSSVADRIRVLYDSMLIGNEMNNSSSSSSEGQESTNTNTNINDASKEQVEKMIQNLQSTCQLVPDAQIVETNSKVPYQTFRVGTGSELARRAREGYGGKKGSQGVTRDGDGPVTLEDFHAILKSRTVCAWGECYIKKSSRTSTSDR
mmetsp:Transcript_27938/g.40975  ORF Transcript_27938/g.40975 Transcript_27938/m.40975 type:complete len:412 (-) Transcript_27938:47-1282(-)